MFWRVAGLATVSPVEVILDRGNYTLEQLLDEDDLIQECKSLNGRLVAFLEAHDQVEKLVHYVVEEPPLGADDKRLYKYPFVSCEVFTCEIEALFNTLLEDEKLLDLLFSFVEPNRPHGALLSGYFCKVAICLIVSRTHEVMQYIRAHKEILGKFVDLLENTSIMEVLMRLAGADEHILMFHSEAVQWLAETDLLSMIVSKLDPQFGPDMHGNAAETLSAIARTAPSALASQLASSEYVSTLFNSIFKEPQSKSVLINALSVCVTLLDPKRISQAQAASTQRGVQVQEGQGGLTTAAPETVEGMLTRLGDLLKLLDTSADDNVMPTTYGQLKPPLGIHRLKIIQFIAVLFRSGSQPAQEELMKLKALDTALRLFFEFPFNNLLHTQVESIISTCLESDNEALLTHLFKDCNLISKLLATEADPSEGHTESRAQPKAGNTGHITRICNKMVQVASNSMHVSAALAEHPHWAKWQEEVLAKRNETENVYQWNCGRPAVVAEPQLETRDGEEELRDRGEFELGWQNSLTRDPFSHRYGTFDGEDVEDVFFDDDTTEVVISSLNLSDELDSSDEDEAPSSTGSDSDEEDTAQRKPGHVLMTPSTRLARFSDGPSSPEATGVSSLSLSDDDEVIVGNDDLATSPPKHPFDLQHLSPPSLPIFGDVKTVEIDLFGESTAFKASSDYFDTSAFKGGDGATDPFADEAPFVPVPPQGLAPHTEPVALPPPPASPAVQQPPIDLFAAAGAGMGGPAEHINLFADAPAFTAFGTRASHAASSQEDAFDLPSAIREASDKEPAEQLPAEGSASGVPQKPKGSKEGNSDVDPSFNDVNFWKVSYDRKFEEELDF